MNLKAIQNLIKFVAKTGVQEVKLEMKDVKLTIKSGTDKIIRHKQIELPEPSILPEPKNDIKNELEKVNNDKNELSIEDSSKYSEKVISITLFFILTEPFGGVILIILGGVTSFGPPEGDCIAAQDKKIKIQKEWKNIAINMNIIGL